MRGKVLPLFLCLATSGAGQSYMSLIGDSSRTWKTEYYGTYTPDCLDTYTSSFWFDGDSVLDGISYAKVRSRTEYYESSILEMCYTWYIHVNPNLFIREDGGHVYARYPSSGEELVYDFTAEVGDSVPVQSETTGEYWNGVQGVREVQLIDSVIVDGGWRRRWILDTVDFGQEDTIFILEGIGGMVGPFTSFEPQIGLSYFQRLICVKEQSEVVYGDTICSLVDQVSTTMSLPWRSAHPNPSDGLVTLDEQTESYGVFTSTGSLVKSASGHQVDLRNAPTGVYIIHVHTADGMLDRREVVLVSHQ